MKPAEFPWCAARTDAEVRPRVELMTPGQFTEISPSDARNLGIALTECADKAERLAEERSKR